MALLVTQGNSDLDSTFLECINSMDANLGTNTYATVSTRRSRPLTFQRADNIVGICAMIWFDQVNSVGYRTASLQLEENVSSVWTVRATAEINQTGIIHGGIYFVSAYFTSPYTVDTSANKWRLSIVTTGGVIGVGDRHIYVTLETGSSGNPYLIPITTATKTFTNDIDGIFVDAGHTLTIDRDVSLRGNANNNQLTNQAKCLIIGNSASVINNNTVPINIDFNGQLLISKTGTFKIGDELSKVTRDKKVTLRAGLASGSAANTNFIFYNNVSAISGTIGDILLYGQPYTKANVTAVANASQRNLTVDAIPASWEVGDLVFIDMLDVLGHSGLSTERGTPYIIDSFPDANTIRLTGNLATRRLIGAVIINASECGIHLTRLSSIQATGIVQIQPAQMATFVYDGVYNERWRIEQRTQSYTYEAMYGKTNKQEIKNSVIGFVSTVGLISSLAICKEGVHINNNYFQQGSLGGLAGTYNKLFKSGAVHFCDNIISQQGNNVFRGNNMNKVIVRRNKFSNSQSSECVLDLNCIDSEVSDNYFYGVSTKIYNIRLANRLKMFGNTYVRNNQIYNFVGNIVNSYENSPSFTDVLITHATFLGSASIDFIVNTPNQSITSDETIVDAIYGSKLRVLNDNEIDKNDRILMPSGNIQRCGNGLSDSTALFNYSIRFNPINDNTEHYQLYPIGNQQGNTLSVVYKVKIPSALYWTDEYVMPTLKVIYDNGLNEVESVMGQIENEWVNISAVFEPTTETGVIEIYLYGFSNQSPPNSYYYLGQAVVNKSDGSQLKLSNLDLFYQGLPIVPTIATMTDYSENLRKLEEDQLKKVYFDTRVTTERLERIDNSATTSQVGQIWSNE